LSSQPRFYVTTPIYYVNDEPHIGHAYTTILADVLARYHRDRGVATFFLTGTDEHGQKVQQAAEKRGVDPKQHCDEVVVRFQDQWKKLNISNDYFIRTTDENHIEVVTALLQKLWDKGFIYRDTYEGWYSVAEERFLTDKEHEDGEWREVKRLSETNYFFRMSEFQTRLIHYIQDHPKFIQPDFRRNEVLGFLKQPLGDLCISRPKSRLSWGIDLPFDTDYVTYVWFDALTNYITAVGYPHDPDRFKKWWPVDYHLIGKDILTTHAVYWPTMLMAAEIPLPKTIFAHGWWLIGKTKMSKSLGNVVRPLDLADKYGTDALRYFLMREMSPGQDASFTEAFFITRYNSDLANDLGNLVNRVTKLVSRFFHGQLPGNADPKPEDADITEQAVNLKSAVDKDVDALKINTAIEKVLEMLREINRYMDNQAPWRVVKTDAGRAGAVLYTVSEALRLAATALHPVMPTKISELFAVFGIASDANISQAEWLNWGYLEPGSKLAPVKGLFPRIDTQAQAPAMTTKSQTKLTSEKPEIEMTDFEKLDLRVVKIIAAEKHPNADRLLKLQVELDGEARQVIAGLANHFDPAELVGKQITIIANLKPVKIRGELSRGMILAADDGNTIAPLIPIRPVVPGSKVR